MKKYVITVLILGMIIVGGCTTTSSVEENKGPQKTIAPYGFAVDLSEGTGTVHSINLTPHEQPIRFFDNAADTTLRSYGTGSEPILIRVTQGDILEVKLTNTLSQETSIHWHGIRLPNNQDGIPGVTQEPIAPGTTYTYRFPVNNAGTFFFHPHINTAEQLGRGLYGILVVEPKSYPFKFDQELVRALKDYRLNNDGTLNENFQSMMDFTHGGRLGNVLTISNNVSPIYEITGGSTSLIRIINPSNARIYNLDFRNRNAQVVGIDGGLVSKPFDAGLLELGPGERIDLLVTIGKEPLQLIDNYFPTNPYQLATLSPLGGEQNSGNYVEINGFPNIPDWSEFSKQEPDEVITLGGIGVMGGDRGMMANSERGWSINDGIRPNTNKILHWKLGEMRTIRIDNKSGRDHPMHLHGDFFQVLGVNGKEVPWHGWKDTINVPAQGYIDLAIIPTNPGTWMFHCHIIEHGEFGMMTTVIID